MNVHSPAAANKYRIDVQPLEGRVTATRGGVVLASSTNAMVMHETRLPATVYFPPEDVRAELGAQTELQTFCPFKGTASYRDLTFDGEVIANAVWCYDIALPESRDIQGHIGFMSAAGATIDTGENTLDGGNDGNISGPLVDWLLRSASYLKTPEEFTAAMAEKMMDQGVAVSRIGVLIWSLHPQIVGKNYVWDKARGNVDTMAPSHELFDAPEFINSPLHYVYKGLGGVRQKLDDANFENSFPVMQDFKDRGATDYVAMPLPFSDGSINVLTMTSDHPDGFTTANLGLIFECVSVIGRFYEVFSQKENAQTLLETYLGQRTGARVLGGDIRRGDGDDIDAAIMFCDLRGSTRLEEKLGRAAYIQLLNQFFETTSNIVQSHGGEVLKFIGDAILAVFPADDGAQSACDQALQSARDIVAQLNAERTENKTNNCECSIGIAFGQVTYGNVGSKERLDFTVIGRAANVAARLADYGKTVGQNIVASCDTARGKFTDHVDLGPVSLHNVASPVDCFAVDLTGGMVRASMHPTGS